MNIRTVETLTEIFIDLAKARRIARAQLAVVDACDLHNTRQQQKYVAISAMIGDVQRAVIEQMKRYPARTRRSPSHPAR